MAQEEGEKGRENPLDFWVKYEYSNPDENEHGNLLILILAY